MDLPHAGEQLHQSTVAEGKADDEIGLGHGAGTHIDQAQDKGGEGESAQAQGSGIGELAVLDALVQAGLELTTKGGKTT